MLSHATQSGRHPLRARGADLYSTPAAAAGGLDAAIERDWHEAEPALETLMRHTPAQAAKVIPAFKVSLITEIVDWLVDLKLEFAVRSAGNGEAPVADLPTARPAGDAGDIPEYLRRDVS